MRLQAYEQLVGELAVEIRGYLINRGADREIAADVVQDVFVKLLEMQLILPPDKLRPYMYRVAWSTYLDGYRRRQRYAEIVQIYLRPMLETVGNLSIETGLALALTRLSPREITLLLLRYEEALSIAEVATRLGVRPATVKMRLHRVHRKLEKVMRSDVD